MELTLLSSCTAPLLSAVRQGKKMNSPIGSASVFFDSASREKKLVQFHRHWPLVATRHPGDF